MTREEAANILSNDIIDGHVEGNARFMDAFWFAVDNLKCEEDLHREREQAYMQGYEDASKRFRIEPSEDCVSREAVIDVIKSMSNDNPSHWHTCDVINRENTIDEVEDLPSVTQARWIPVSERLPEKDGLYLAWVDWGNGHEILNFDTGCEKFGNWIKKYNTQTGGCMGEDFFEDQGVLAWMPLPEPYKGG